MSTTPARYRKRPVVIEAMQLIDDLGNHVAIAEWIVDNGGAVTIPPLDPHLIVSTLEGDMRAEIGDWIIRGVKGEFYPCKPDVFEATYELADGTGAPAPDGDPEAMREAASRLLTAANEAEARR